MASSDTASLTEHFGSLVDPRIDRTKRHKLTRWRRRPSSAVA